MLKVLTHSSNGTKRFAKVFAKKILARSYDLPKALIIGLTGDLGAGKTTFIQGFCKGVGIKKHITSPTFIIFKRFKIHDSRFKNLYHIDCYRIQKPQELLKLDFKKIISNPEDIVLIEWAEKIKQALPKNTIWMKFGYGKKENERKIIFATKYEKFTNI